MRRRRRIVLGSVLALVVLSVLALVVLLGSETGSRWLFGRIPGVQVDGFTGRLGGSWQAERLFWQQGERRVELEAPQLAWSPRCLLSLTLCLDRVIAERVILTFPPSPEEETAPVPLQLPDLNLPLALRLGEVRVASLSLNGSEQASGLQLQAQWAGEGLRIERLSARRGDLALELRGSLTPRGDWPLVAEGNVALPEVGEQPWVLALRADGDLAGRLKLIADSSGYLAAHLEGDLQPLAENLPLRARLTADGFKPTADLPDTLVLNAVELTADGNLAEGYEILGTARLPAEQSPIDLALQGRVDGNGARIDALELLATKTQRLVLNGSVDWRETLQAEARVDWRDFPWRRLYPIVDEPPVVLKTLQAEVSYREGSYLGNFDASMEGPAGSFTLASPVSGDLQQVHLPSLRLVAGQGRAEGQLSLGFADGIRWKTDLTLDDLDPAYWLAELPGRLAGPLRSQGQWRDGRLGLDAELHLDGTLRGQPAQLQLSANGEGERWALGALDVRLGPNRIQGAGQLEQRLQGYLKLDMPRLGSLWPGLSGALNGRLDVAGTLDKPQGQLHLKGQTMAFEDKRLKALSVDARLDASQHGVLAADLQGIRLGDNELGQLLLSGQGDRQRQQLELSLDGPKLRTHLALAGDWQTQAQGWSWRGQIRDGLVETGGQLWNLQRPARLERLASGRIDLGAHCWQSGVASLCGEDQRLMPDPRIRYRLRGFPLDSLAHWWPQDFAWQGELNADLELDLPASGPNGRIQIDASGGTFRLREAGEWLEFPYGQLRLDSQLRPQRVDTRLDFIGQRLGDLTLEARIDPRPAAKPLSGSFQLRGLDLSVARPFVPMVEQLEGHLNGNGTLSGSLQQPQIDGRIVLDGGQIGGGDLPTRFDDLRLQALIAGESLQLSGDWKSGEHGQGSLSGEMAWSDDLVLDLRVRGNRLAVVVDPYAELEVEPDMRIGMAGDRLALTGKVLVPRGAITVRELPPSTVKVSPDTVVVGAEKPEAGQGMSVAMDIDVEVGQDKLTFSGFGLNAELAGYMHIGDNLDARGELNLNNGRYRAYGQRLTIRRARLLFAGPIDQPYLDVEAIRRVEDVVAGLRLTGNAAAPRTEVFSEPVMSQEQALSYLVLGRPLGGDQGDNNMLAQAALGLGLAGSSSITGGLAKNLGIENFQLEAEGSGNATSVVASGSLTERLSLRYGVGVFEPANTIALRYQLTKRVFLEAASGLASSLDIFYKRDF